MKANLFQYENYRGIEVAWTAPLDGGGRSYGQNFIPVVSKLLGRVGVVHEFCAGPGFIGFSLLAAGLCDSCCLSDVNPEAIAAINETVLRNGLQDRVRVYLSDGLNGIPSSEKWDLVVSNPPHFLAESQKDILRHDPNWDIHRGFFSNVHRFLHPHSNILFQENYCGSEESIFLPMIEASDLEYMGSFMHRKADIQFRDVYYFLWLKTRNPELIWQDSPVQTLSFYLSALQGGCFGAKLRARQKYRFEIRNDLGHASDVLLITQNAAFSSSDIVVFSMKQIMPRKAGTSTIFYLTPGRFELVDSAGGLLQLFECQ